MILFLRNSFESHSTRRLARTALLAFAALLSTSSANSAQAQSASPVDVYFAGVAFTGNKESATEAFPHTSAILDADGQIAALNAAMREGFKQAPPTALNIKYDDLANLDGSTSAIAFAASIDRETVIVEKIGERYKILVEIAANALFFDFREKMVVASWPITLQRIDIASSEPDTEQIRSVVRHVLTSPTEDAFVANVVATVHSAVIPQAASRRIQVSSMVLSAAAQTELITSGRDPGILQEMLANELTKILGEQQHIGLLPYQKGQAIGGAMSTRFADGRVYMLTIPKPDYVVSVEVEALKSKVLQETTVARNILYGAFYRVSVVEPLSNKSYFSQSLRQGSTRIIPVTQEHVDHPAAHYENLLVGFDSFAQAIHGERASWVREQTDPKELSKEFKQLAKLVETCR